MATQVRMLEVRREEGWRAGGCGVACRPDSPFPAPSFLPRWSTPSWRPRWPKWSRTRQAPRARQEAAGERAEEGGAAAAGDRPPRPRRMDHVARTAHLVARGRRAGLRTPPVASSVARAAAPRSHSLPGPHAAPPTPPAPPVSRVPPATRQGGGNKGRAPHTCPRGGYGDHGGAHRRPPRLASARRPLERRARGVSDREPPTNAHAPLLRPCSCTDTAPMRVSALALLALVAGAAAAVRRERVEWT